MKKRVLIIDSDRDTAKSVSEILKESGYAVTRVDSTDIAEGLAMFGDGSIAFDFILCANDLPNGAGGMMLALLRRSGLPLPTFIFLAKHPTAEDVRGLLKPECDYILVVPTSLVPLEVALTKGEERRQEREFQKIMRNA